MDDDLARFCCQNPACADYGKFHVESLCFRSIADRRRDIPPLNLARGRAWNRVDDVELFGPLEIRQPFLAERQQLGFRGRPILLQDHGAKVRFRNLWIVPKKDAK